MRVLLLARDGQLELAPQRGPSPFAVPRSPPSKVPEATAASPAGEGGGGGVTVVAVSDVAPWRQQAAAGAVVTAMALGMRDVLGPPKDGPAVIVPYPEIDEPDDAITLFFHPEVPEATLVLLRPRPPAAPT